MSALKLVDNLIGFIDNKEEKQDTPSRVTSQTYTSLRSELTSLIQSKGCAPILVRLAWHDAGTFCAKTNTGGPRAAQRFDDGESKHGANAGLDVARGLLQPLVNKYCNTTYNVSIADLWALAGNTSISVSGGPDIAFQFGRKDIKSSKECVEEGRLPDGDKGLDHLRKVFNRMGFNDREIVALSGAHTLGSCHGDRSGFEGAWTAQPLKFDNSFFKDIINKKWVANKSSKGCPQLKNSSDEKDNTMMLTTDYCLFERKETKAIVEAYAKDEKVFFNDFGKAWIKLITGGYTDKDLYGVKLLVEEQKGDDRVSSDTYTSLRNEIVSLIKEKGCAPILVRLAWHDAGTFCAKTNTGGPRAAQRFDDGESKHGANAGLDVARGLLQPLVNKYCNTTYNVSIADLWALAGNTSISVSGGPDIAFQFGRKDIKSSKECVEEGRLPDGDKGLDHLRKVFNRMGFNDREIVALSGAHTLGSCHGDRSGFEGAWTAQPLKFDNSFFKDIINKKWVANKSSKGCPQLKNSSDKKDNTMMLTTDYCLFERKETKAIVEAYAKDEKVFFNDFGKAWIKLITGGYTDKDLYGVKLNK